MTLTLAYGCGNRLGKLSDDYSSIAYSTKSQNALHFLEHTAKTFSNALWNKVSPNSLVIEKLEGASVWIKVNGMD